MDTPFKDFPFKAVLSLKPLIDYLKGLGSEGRNVRPHIKKEIDELLGQAPELEGPIEDLSHFGTARGGRREADGICVSACLLGDGDPGSHRPDLDAAFLRIPRVQGSIRSKGGGFQGALQPR